MLRLTLNNTETKLLIDRYDPTTKHPACLVVKTLVLKSRYAWKDLIPTKVSEMFVTKTGIPYELRQATKEEALTHGCEVLSHIGAENINFNLWCDVCNEFVQMHAPTTSFKSTTNVNHRAYLSFTPCSCAPKLKQDVIKTTALRVREAENNAKRQARRLRASRTYGQKLRLQMLERNVQLATNTTQIEKLEKEVNVSKKSEEQAKKTAKTMRYWLGILVAVILMLCGCLAILNYEWRETKKENTKICCESSESEGLFEKLWEGIVRNTRS